MKLNREQRKKDQWQIKRKKTIERKVKRKNNNKRRYKRREMKWNGQSKRKNINTEKWMKINYKNKKGKINWKKEKKTVGEKREKGI